MLPFCVMKRSLNGCEGDILASEFNIRGQIPIAIFYRLSGSLDRIPTPSFHDLAEMIRRAVRKGINAGALASCIRQAGNQHLRDKEQAHSDEANRN